LFWKSEISFTQNYSRYYTRLKGNIKDPLVHFSKDCYHPWKYATQNSLAENVSLILGGGAVSEPSICRSYGKKDDDW
jgi:hypothetical protein